MKLQYPASFILIAIAAWVGMPFSAQACRCAKVNPKQHVASHDYIARVRTLRTRKIGKWRTRYNAMSTVTVISVVKSPARLLGKETVDVSHEAGFANSRRSSCAVDLPHQTDFWLFAKDEEGQLRTYECSLAPARGLFGNNELKSLLEGLPDKR